MIANLVLGMFLLGSTTAGSARILLDTAPAEASLRGLKAVYVSVRYNAPPEMRYGLGEAELRSEVKLTLNASGVRTLKSERWKKEAGKPYLCVHVVGNTLDARSHDTTFFYTVTLELVQQVALGRDPRLRCPGVTWSEGTTLVLPRDRLRTVAEQLGSLAADFSRAVQEANPESLFR